MSILYDINALEAACQILTECRRKLDKGPDRQDVWNFLFRAEKYLVEQWEDAENETTLGNG